MASTDATPIAIKNQAYRVVFPIWDADGDLVSGATGLDSEISKDQNTFADCTNEATEIASSSGVYYLDLTATEMNADNVAIIIKTSTVGAKTTVLTIYPSEASDIKVNVVQTAADSITNASFASGTIIDADIVSINGSTSAAQNAQYFWDGATVTDTAQAGNASSITLAAGSSAIDDYYNQAAITIVSGTGAGQTRKISDYDGTTKIATVDVNWTTDPDNTSVYQIIGRIV